MASAIDWVARHFLQNVPPRLFYLSGALSVGPTVLGHGRPGTATDRYQTHQSSSEDRVGGTGGKRVF
jgi:hypothetical protein